MDDGWVFVGPFNGGGGRPARLESILNNPGWLAGWLAVLD
jgi:hypothetical protein